MSEDLSIYKGKLVAVPPPSLTMEKIRWLSSYYNLDIKEKNHSLTICGSLIKKFFGRGLFIDYPVKKSFNTDRQAIMNFFDPLVEKKLGLISKTGLSSPLIEAQNLINYNIRNYAYGNISHNREAFINSLTYNVPNKEKYFIKYITYPALRVIIGNKKSLKNTYSKVKQGYDLANKIFSDGREFLNKEKFSYLDINFCVIAAPTVIPPEYADGKLLPDIDSLPAEFKKQVLEFRNTPTGKYVLNIYKKYRKLNYKDFK